MPVYFYRSGPPVKLTAGADATRRTPPADDFRSRGGSIPVTANVEEAFMRRAHRSSDAINAGGGAGIPPAGQR